MPTELISVIGCPRCGSASIELAMHEGFELTAAGDIASVWETGLANYGNCGCGAPVRACPFWSEVVRDGFGQVSFEDARQFARVFREARGRLLQRRQLSGRFDGPTMAFREIASTLYQSVAKIGGGRPILDSSKVPAFAAALSSLGLGPSGGLHIFRDACENVQRLRTKPFRLRSDHSESEVPVSRSIIGAICRWSIRNWEAKQLAIKLGYDCPTLSVAQFLAAPDPHLAGLQATFGLSRKRREPGMEWHRLPGRFGGISQPHDIHRMSLPGRILTRALTAIEQNKLEGIAEAWVRGGSDCAAGASAAAA